jgi:hypothetical protein
MPTSKQARKRLVVALDSQQHACLQKQADKLGLSLGNMIRRALLLPDVQQGQRLDLEEGSPVLRKVI